MKKCFDPDIYPMIKNSNPVIDYNDLVGYINEYNQNWQNNMTFKQYLQQRFTKN
ncbi:MAG: hypothetical protein K6E76_04690 [Patescibacteria group bacterium]|nr:hypothetical protein [Patescibacteria group bacterium]